MAAMLGSRPQNNLRSTFHLDDRDRTLLEPRRHAHTRLGFALQLCTVRFLGTFLSDPTDVPHSVVLSLASQLTIADPAIVLPRYREGQMRHDHVHEIMQEYGYHDFGLSPNTFALHAGFEVAQQTGFLSQFTHVSDSNIIPRLPTDTGRLFHGEG